MRCSRRLVVPAAVLLVSLAGCHSGVHSGANRSATSQQGAAHASEPSSASPVRSSPPAAVGSGEVCAAAADRLMHVEDHLDLARVVRTPPAPRNHIIVGAVGRYVAARGQQAARRRAEGLILGQCAAYGFDPGPFNACMHPRVHRHVAAAGAVRSCLARGRWTIYTMQ